jgi:hypothetical protein
MTPKKARAQSQRPVDINIVINSHFFLMTSTKSPNLGLEMIPISKY